tara:strand:+ start:2741 stop:2854 length:114 start_codon:yes stop_codon:yes gene_type:complete
MTFRFGATIYQILPNLPKNEIGKQVMPPIVKLMQLKS